MEMKTENLAQDNIKKIAELFPECITEIYDERLKKNKLSIDFDKLKNILSDEITDEIGEKYQFTWPNKNKTISEMMLPTSNTLRPSKKESKNFDLTENVYIKGDNLETLKILRQTYHKKIKLIYIDPPYNTGNDFVYNDSFTTNLNEYDLKNIKYDEDNNVVFKNTETNGRFHTDWLNMIYPRIRLSRELLTDDGAIFISISDAEVANLIKICDEIFGKSNFIADICHKARASVSNDRIISENHNHLLFYAKNERILFSKHKLIGEDPDLTGFNLNDEKGAYKLVPVDGPGGAKKGNPYYEFLGISGYWRYSKTTMEQKYKEGLIVKTEKGLQQKYYMDKAKQSRKTVTTWWDDGFLTSSATSELTKLMGCKTFDNPKNVKLIKRILNMIVKFDTDAIILDFFSGSATTAQAVMEMNYEDCGHRKYILVQIPEKCPKNSDAYIAGYNNICDIALDRIDKSSKLFINKNIDLGYRVFTLDSSNMKNVYYSPDNTFKSGLDSFLSTVKEDRTSEDLLFQSTLELGIELSTKIEVKNIDGKTIYVVDDGYLIACFDEDLPESVINIIAKRSPEYLVIRNHSSLNDCDMINFEQIFNAYSPETKIKII